MTSTSGEPLSDDEIVGQLNAYEETGGDNIWGDLIWEWPLDNEAIGRLDPGSASDVFVLADGRVFRYSGQTRQWGAAGMLADVEAWRS